MTTTPNGMDGRSVLKGTELRIATALQGVQTVLPQTTPLTVGGVSLTVPNLEAQLTAAQKVYSEPREMRAQLHELTGARNVAEPGIIKLLDDLDVAVTAQ